jgi:hypothetical protein
MAAKFVFDGDPVVTAWPYHRLYAKNMAVRSLESVHMPDRIVTNAVLAKAVDTNDARMVARTGI